MADNIKFSIITSAYNAKETIMHCVRSVLCQTYDNYEYIILENGSTDETREYIRDNIENLDDRIRVIYLDDNVGWSKGTSICLKEAAGDYMTMLAADDYLTTEVALEYLANEIMKNAPDVVIIGNTRVEYNSSTKNYNQLSGNIYDYCLYTGDNKIDDIGKIISESYYNSMFHFIKIDMLREYGIDFYEPYYSDNESMTEVVCRAKRILVVDVPLYALTENTSQTSCSFPNRNFVVNQWRSIERVLVENGECDFSELSRMAIKTLNNGFSCIASIMEGAPIRDLNMRPVCIDENGRFDLAEEFLNSKEIRNMYVFSQFISFERFAETTNRMRAAAHVLSDKIGREEALLNTGITIKDLFEFLLYYLDIALLIKNREGRNDYLNIIENCCKLFEQNAEMFDETQRATVIMKLSALI